MRAARLTCCWLLLPAVVGLAFVPGCNKAPPPITKETYTIPTVIVKQQEEKAQLEKNLELAIKRSRENTQPAPIEQQRMLAALVPQPETNFFWTFKVQGDPKELERVKPGLEKLLASLEWKSKESMLPEWQLPEDWQSAAQEDGFGRVATITLPEDAGAFKIAVAKFTSNGDWQQAALTNLNRWRGQLKLEPITAAGIDASTTKINFTGGEAILMDETGVATARPGMSPQPTTPKEPPAETKAPAETPALPAANTASDLIEFQAPEAWKSKRGSALRVATFAVTEGEQLAEVAITQFPKVAQMTDPLANVNRWRGELGLKPAAESELPEQTSELKIGDQPATIFFATGTAREQPTSTLAAMIVRNDRVWFVKLQGAAALVSKQRPVFEEFVKSLKFKE
jgi:hypothetical protein